MTFIEELERESPLGKESSYCEEYDPKLLCGVPRDLGRQHLDWEGTLPFQGRDIWTAYELSWLDAQGKPQVAIAEFSFPWDSSSLVESKSFKLYLNSFNNSRFPSVQAVQKALATDLSQLVEKPVEVQVLLPESWGDYARSRTEGTCIDDLDLPAKEGQLLLPEPEIVEETLFTRLFRSNCLITGQPDWANVEIRYTGPQWDRAQLLRYLISYRNHRGFHEQCMEQIFVDLLRRCEPERLTVLGRFTRRGGLDINPFRSNFEEQPSLPRHQRQ